MTFTTAVFRILSRLSQIQPVETRFFRKKRISTVAPDSLNEQAHLPVVRLKPPPLPRQEIEASWVPTTES